MHKRGKWCGHVFVAAVLALASSAEVRGLPGEGTSRLFRHRKSTSSGPTLRRLAAVSARDNPRDSEQFTHVDESLRSRLRSHPRSIGFSFSASGLMMPYHYGVGAALRDADYIRSGTKLAGSSGGAIAAAAIACELDNREVIRGINAVSKDCRDNGSFRRMLVPARRLCQEILPKDAHEKMSGNVNVAVAQILPRPKRLFVNSWTSKDDVIDSLMASSNIPFVLAPTVLVPFRDGLCIDGSFATQVGSFGCCETAGERTVRVMAFDPRPWKSLAKTILNDPMNAIAPGLREGDGFEYDTSKSLRFAAGYPPPDENEVENLYRLGYRAAEMWIEEDEARRRRSAVVDPI